MVSDGYEEELAEFTHWLDCECFPFEWRFTHAKHAIQHQKRTRHPYRLLKSIARLGVQPDRVDASLQLLGLILDRPSDELRWSIRFKELGPVISLGLSSANANVRSQADYCRDMLLKLGCFDFGNLGRQGME